MAKTSSGYSRLQITLHWVIAGLIVFQFLGHDAVHEVMDTHGIAASDAENLPMMAGAHIYLGILIFWLMVARVALRFTHGVPALPEEEKPVMKLLAHATHFMLYAALFLMPLSGAIGWFGQVENAFNAHRVLKVVLLAFVALHIAGALYHQLVLKNHLIKRMMKAG